MSKYIGKGATIKRSSSGGIDTSGESCVIVAWNKDIRKYEVDFGNGFCGWYKRAQLIIDV